MFAARLSERQRQTYSREQIEAEVLRQLSRHKRNRRTGICSHLQSNTGESVDLTNCGCGDKRASVWECSLHGLCVPFGRGETITAAQDCRTCESYKEIL